MLIFNVVYLQKCCLQRFQSCDVDLCFAPKRYQQKFREFGFDKTSNPENKSKLVERESVFQFSTQSIMDEFEDVLDYEPDEVDIPCAQAVEEPPQLEVRTPPPSKKRFTFKPVEPADDGSGDNGEPVVNRQSSQSGSD